MNQRIAIGVLTCAMALAGCVDAAGEKKNDPTAPQAAAPGAAAAPGTLQSAHAAYLEGDFLAVGERIRDVLLDTRSSDDVKENAFELLDKAFEVQHGTLPSRFVLPPELEGLKFGAVHGASPQGPFFRIFMYGHIRDIAHLKRVVVKRLPDETLLDSADGSGKGKLVIKHDKAGYDTFVVERVVPALPDDGVVSLRIELDDGTAPEGWFISHKLASSTTPEIRSPLSSASISDVHPLVSWVPFHSPEYLPFEWRTLSVYVSSDTTKDTAWDFWTKDYGDLAAVRIGDHPPAAKTSLIPGGYWLNVSCSEGRMFGPIAITRDARTVGPFHLVP